MKFYRSYEWGDTVRIVPIAESYDESQVYIATEGYYLDRLGESRFDIVMFNDEDEEIGCQTVEFDAPITYKLNDVREERPNR